MNGGTAADRGAAADVSDHESQHLLSGSLSVFLDELHPEIRCSFNPASERLLGDRRAIAHRREPRSRPGGGALGSVRCRLLGVVAGRDPTMDNPPRRARRFRSGLFRHSSGLVGSGGAGQTDVSGTTESIMEASGHAIVMYTLRYAGESAIDDLESDRLRSNGERLVSRLIGGTISSNSPIDASPFLTGSRTGRHRQ